MTVGLLHESEEAEIGSYGFSNRQGEPVSKRYAFGAAFFSFLALTGGS
jgi:hypothetical protein